MSFPREECVACQGTGISYWSEGYYGECFSCDKPVHKKKKKKKKYKSNRNVAIYHLLSKDMGACEGYRQTKEKLTKNTELVDCKRCIKRINT